MKKRGLSIILGGALFFAIMTGCSSSNSTQPADAEPETPTVTEPEEENNPIVIYGDTISSNGCVISARFTHGEQIVFRATAIDGVTKEQLEDAEVTLVLGNGEELPMVLGPHGQKETMFWTVPYVVPDDMPTGTLDYKYVAKFNGQEAEYAPFDVQPTLLTIIANEEETEEEAES